MLVTFLRWYLLVVTQGLRFRVRDSLRIGFIGFLFSQVIPGAVSGDLVKVAMLVREQERRTVAVATVILDRVLGLYGLVLLAGLAALFSWRDIRDVPELHDLAVWVMALVGAGTVGFASMFLPFFRGKWADTVSNIPMVGKLFRELIGSIVVYQGKYWVIVISVAMSVLGHLGFVSALYCVAAGLQGSLWPWQLHFVVAPLGLMINAIPISPGGVGVGEAAMQALFSAVGQDGAKALLMMLSYRAISWLLALIGVGYLVTGGFSETRRAMADSTATQPLAAAGTGASPAPEATSLPNA
jgi:uncharacterized protein (TIRG00374 family)